MKEQIKKMNIDVLESLAWKELDDGVTALDIDGITEHLRSKGYHKQEWISVEDRLPENGLERVLVFLRENDFTKYIGENKIDTDRYIDGKWVRWSKHVTHWMPLPEPPKKGGAE